MLLSIGFTLITFFWKLNILFRNTVRYGTKWLNKYVAIDRINSTIKQWIRNRNLYAMKAFWRYFCTQCNAFECTSYEIEGIELFFCIFNRQFVLIILSLNEFYRPWLYINKHFDLFLFNILQHLSGIFFVFCVALKNLLSFLISCCVPGVNDEHRKTDQWSVSWSLLPIRSHQLESGPTVWRIQPRINASFDLRGPKRFQISRCPGRNREMWTGTGMMLLFFSKSIGWSQISLMSNLRCRPLMTFLPARLL